MPKKNQSRKTQKKKKKRSRARNPRTSKGFPSMSRTWYSVLGVSPQADSETIRQQYLDLVRQFPPETHPEDFATIRHAYEVLSDVNARHRYDRERFYGTTATQLRALIEQHGENGRFEEAARLLKQVVDMDPKMEEMVQLGVIYQMLEQPREAEKWIRQGLAACETEEAKVSVLIAMAHLSHDDHEIVAALQKVGRAYPHVSQAEVAREVLIHYEALDDIDQGMAYFRKLIPRRKYPTADDFEVYIKWMEALAELDYVDILRELFVSRVKPAAQRAARGPHSQDIAQRFVAYIADLDLDPSQLPLWRVQTMVADLAHIVAPDDSEIHTQWRDSLDISMTMSQVERLMEDDRVPTSLVVRAFESVILAGEDPDGILAEAFEERVDTSRTLPEGEAIAVIQQIYPRIYHRMQEVQPWARTVPGRVDKAD